MDIEKIISDAVREHNLTNPGFIIRKIQSGDFEWYFLYSEDGNIWYSEELRLFLYLYRKLSQDRVYPFICVWEINGEDRIGIFIPDILVL